MTITMSGTDVQVTLVDVNPRMVQAWRDAFAGDRDVQILQGSLLSQQTSAWVSPTNRHAKMDGGVDGAIRGHLGRAIERKVQAAVRAAYDGELPIGYATCVHTGRVLPAYVISTPTVFDTGDDVRDTLNAACAAAAAFQAIHQQNRAVRGSIRSVALPGLGAGSGRVDASTCAELMWIGYDLFREQAFEDYASMRAALEERLGDLGPSVRPQAAYRARQAAIAAAQGGYFSHTNTRAGV